MIFWILIAAMTLAGVVMIALPVFLTREHEREDAHQQDQLRRLDELDEDLASGDIDASASSAVRSELERAVVDNIAAVRSHDPARERRTIPGLLAVCALVPLVAFVVYLQTGSPHIAEFEATHPELDLGAPAASAEILLEQLRDRLADTPDDRDGWLVLVQTNMQLGRYVEAVSAAERLYGFAPRDPLVILALIDALAMAHGGQIVGRAQALIDEVLAVDAQNATAMILKGIVVQQAGDSASALSWWLRARAATAPDSPLRKELINMIAHARGETAPLPATQAQPAARLKVRVSLDESLAARTQPDDTVFVIARAVDGPKVPLAVSRHTRAQLPLTITLDETMGMVPGMSLVDFEKVYVVARISAGGTPQAQSGDLEGRSGEILLENVADTAVRIDTVVP